jgi:hypothetical protein
VAYSPPVKEGIEVRYDRDRRRMMFWRAKPHPFMPRRTRPKHCKRCALGRSNPVHLTGKLGNTVEI